MFLSVWELLHPVWELRAGWEDWRDKGTYRQMATDKCNCLICCACLKVVALLGLLGSSPAGPQGEAQGVNPATLRLVH